VVPVEAAQQVTPSDEPAARLCPQVPDVAAVKGKASTGERNASVPRDGSKTSRVIAMLKREGGATLEEIMSEMGWQQHSTRSMMSAGGSLAKKHGLIVTSEKVGDQRTYLTKG
jgi:hypothetical protein